VNRVRIDLAYDGGPFSGFARQRDRTTVQGTLEGALSRVLGQEVATTCAGRTDAGVHALAQVVHLDVDRGVARAARWLRLVDADPEIVRRRLDRLVGDAITIWSVRTVGDDFDARFSATERRYRYRLVEAAATDPRLRGVRWAVGEDLHVPSMRAAARHLLGEHDFASLCRQAPGKHTVRRLDAVTVTRADGEVHVRLRGPAFCHQQVRSIVGCLVDVGVGRRDPDWMAEVLAARDRSAAARVAPAHGLTLEGVSYGRGNPAAPPADVI
jgi:tRNA pseudouridine38-40 synthase